MVLVDGGVCQVSRGHHRCAQCSLPSDCQGGTAANSSQQQQHHQHQNRSWPHRATAAHCAAVPRCCCCFFQLRWADALKSVSVAW